MGHTRFTVQIDLFKYKRFKDGGCAYKNTESRHLKVARTYLYARRLCFWIAFFGRNDLTDFYEFWHP